MGVSEKNANRAEGVGVIQYPSANRFADPLLLCKLFAPFIAKFW